MFNVRGSENGLPKGRDPQGEQNHANTFLKIVVLGEKVASVFLGSRGGWTRSGRLVNMFKSATQSATLWYMALRAHANRVALMRIFY